MRRQIDVDQTTPVQSERREQSGILVDVVVPLLQSFAVAALAAAVLVAFVNLVYDAGEFPFWVGSGIVGFSAFLWVLVVQWDKGVSPLDLLTALLMSVLAGFFCWAFARVATWSKSGWLNIWLLASFAGILVFYLHVELTLLQRLAQPWQFQRKAIWETIRDVLTFWLKKEPAERPQPLPREVVVTLVDGNTNSRTHDKPPVNDETFTAVCCVLHDKTFTEANLCGNGRPLPGGMNGRNLKDNLRAWMIERGYLRWNVIDEGTGEGIPGQGVSLTELGQWLVLAALDRPTPPE